MLNFTLSGLLMPPGVIASDAKEFEYEFVVRLGGAKRLELFKKYKLYCEELKAVCSVNQMVQWVDGSYVTLNKNPVDIDLVTFIDYGTAKIKQQELKRFIYPQSLENYGVDGYLIVVHRTESGLSYITEADKAFWQDHFGRTKPSRQSKRLPKGFLEIIV